MRRCVVSRASVCVTEAINSSLTPQKQGAFFWKRMLVQRSTTNHSTTKYFADSICKAPLDNNRGDNKTPKNAKLKSVVRLQAADDAEKPLSYKNTMKTRMLCDAMMRAIRKHGTCAETMAMDSAWMESGVYNLCHMLYRCRRTAARETAVMCLLFI